jgi:hypothetical protein
VKQRIFSPFDLHQTSAKAAHRSEARDRPRPVLRRRNRTDQARDDVEARTSMSAWGHKRTFLFWQVSARGRLITRLRLLRLRKAKRNNNNLCFSDVQQCFSDACRLYDGKRRPSHLITSLAWLQQEAAFGGISSSCSAVPGSLPGGVWLRFRSPRPARGSWMRFDRNRWRRAPAMPWASW